MPVSAQVPDLSAAQARVLFSAGWRDAAALALAEPGDVAKALVATLPSSMRGKRSANGRAKAHDVRRMNPGWAPRELQSCLAQLTCTQLHSRGQHGAVGIACVHRCGSVCSAGTASAMGTSYNQAHINFLSQYPPRSRCLARRNVRFYAGSSLD